MCLIGPSGFRLTLTGAVSIEALTRRFAAVKRRGNRFDAASVSEGVLGALAMRFGILGPVQVVAGDGRELTLRSGLQRTLLAALLLRANQTVSSDQLIEDLWAARAPAGAAKALQVDVSRLRRALDWETGAGCPLATHAGGYLLRVDADQLDSVVFERLLYEGKRLVATGDPAAAADLISQALGLWRGSPLADLTTAEFAQAEIRRLEELRLAATMERIDADLVLGADAPLIPELEALVESNPLQERLRAQLMRALYQAGRQADALAVYRETSALLRGGARSGTKPSAAGTRAHDAATGHDAGGTKPGSPRSWLEPAASCHAVCGPGS